VTRPTLTTERLRLEPLTTEHLEDLVALDADPEVLRFVFGRALTRDEVVEVWLPRRTDPVADARALGYWVGLADGAFIGWWSLAYDASRPDTAELGYRLRREAWGRGYATEGAAALLAHAFGAVGLGSVWAEAMVVNDGSRRVLTKLGLHHVRTDHREWDDPLPGAEHGEAVYELRAEDFPG
jgi:RimJ/RimL family protein N-acetyltransferase